MNNEVANKPDARDGSQPRDPQRWVENEMNIHLSDSLYEEAASRGSCFASSGEDLASCVSLTRASSNNGC